MTNRSTTSQNPESPTTNMTPLLYETHMHTPLCNHAHGEPGQYAQVAHERGLRGIIVTCHNPTNDGWSPTVRMAISDLDDYLAMVDEARVFWQGRIDVRLGIESDYYPGAETWLEQLHGMADFHYVLGSVHPQLPQYQERFDTGDPVEFQRTYFEHLAMAAESGLFDTLSHPDLVKNSTPDTWDLAPVFDHVCRCLDRIAAAGTAMELNTSGLNKAFAEMNPGREILEQMHRRDIPVVMGTDVHTPERVAANFVDALDQLADVGYAEVSLFLNRQRQTIPIDRARASLVLGMASANDTRA